MATIDYSFRLIDTDGNTSDSPGNNENEIAISGNFLAVGVPDETAGGQSSAGKVHVYNLATGALLYSVQSPSPVAFRSFGYAVCFGGNFLFVGDPSLSIVFKFSASSGEYISQINGDDVNWDPVGLVPRVPGWISYFGSILTANDTTLFIGDQNFSYEDPFGFGDIYQSGIVFAVDFDFNYQANMQHPNMPTDDGGFTQYDAFAGQSIAATSTQVCIGARFYDRQVTETYKQFDAGFAAVYDAVTGAFLYQVDSGLYNNNLDQLSGEWFGFSVTFAGTDDQYLVCGAPFEHSTKLDPNDSTQPLYYYTGAVHIFNAADGSLIRIWEPEEIIGTRPNLTKKVRDVADAGWCVAGVPKQNFVFINEVRDSPFVDAELTTFFNTGRVILERLDVAATTQIIENPIPLSELTTANQNGQFGQAIEVTANWVVIAETYAQNPNPNLHVFGSPVPEVPGFWTALSSRTQQYATYAEAVPPAPPIHNAATFAFVEYPDRDQVGYDAGYAYFALSGSVSSDRKYMITSAEDWSPANTSDSRGRVYRISMTNPNEPPLAINMIAGAETSAFADFGYYSCADENFIVAGTPYAGSNLYVYTIDGAPVRIILGTSLTPGGAVPNTLGETTDIYGGKIVCSDYDNAQVYVIDAASGNKLADLTYVAEIEAQYPFAWESGFSDNPFIGEGYIYIAHFVGSPTAEWPGGRMAVQVFDSSTYAYVRTLLGDPPAVNYGTTWLNTSFDSDGRRCCVGFEYFRTPGVEGYAESSGVADVFDSDTGERLHAITPSVVFASFNDAAAGQLTYFGASVQLHGNKVALTCRTANVPGLEGDWSRGGVFIINLLTMRVAEYMSSYDNPKSELTSSFTENNIMGLNDGVLAIANYQQKWIDPKTGSTEFNVGAIKFHSLQGYYK